jgi:hypothetical protein
MRIILLTLFLLSHIPVRSQSLLFGFKGGINFTLANPTQRFSVVQPLPGTGMTVGTKNYGFFLKNMGYQYGFIGMYPLSEKLLISLEPTFSTCVIRYETRATWNSGTTATETIEITSRFRDKISYIEIPAEMRYVFGNGKWKPFLAAGIFYGLRTGAFSTIHSTTIQQFAGTPLTIDDQTIKQDVSQNYITSRLATFPGAGLFVELDHMILFGEADYFIGLHNIVDESARYSNQQTSGGSYNVPDNLKPDNLVINIGVLFRIMEKKGGSAVECTPFKRKR